MAINDACLCGTGFNNTGLPSCVKLFKKTTGLFVVPIYDNDGAKNYLDMSTTIDITAKTQATDPSKRWYPINDLKDVEIPTAETRFENAKDGSKFRLAKGITSFNATIFESGSMYTAKLDGVSCNKFGVVLYDIDGNARGKKSGTKFYPIEIGGWDAMFMDATDDAVSKTRITFDFDILNKISQYWILSATDLGANPNDLVGLVDANITLGTPTSTTVQVTALSDYGSGVSTTAGAITGLVASDFKVYNTTDASNVTVTVAETADGVYTLTFTAQTTSDVGTVQILPASGFESNIASITFA